MCLVHYIEVKVPSFLFFLEYFTDVTDFGHLGRKLKFS